MNTNTNDEVSKLVATLQQVESSAATQPSTAATLTTDSVLDFSASVPRFCSKATNRPCECNYCKQNVFELVQSDIVYSTSILKIKDHLKSEEAVASFRTNAPDVYKICHNIETNNLPAGFIMYEDNDTDSDDDDVTMEEESSEDGDSMEVDSDSDEEDDDDVGVNNLAGTSLNGNNVHPKVIPFGNAKNLEKLKSKGMKYFEYLLAGYIVDFAKTSNSQGNASLPLICKIVDECKRNGYTFYGIEMESDGGLRYTNIINETKGWALKRQSDRKDGSLHHRIVQKLYKLVTDGAHKDIDKYKKYLKEQQQQKQLKSIPLIGLGNPNFVAAHEQGYVAPTDAHFKQMYIELENGRNLKKKNEAVDPPTNDHKRMMEVYIDNAEVYQRLLEEDKYYKMNKEGISAGELKTRREKLNKDIHTITGYDIDTTKDRGWGAELSSVKYNLDKLLSKQCYFTGKECTEDNSAEFAMDHLPGYKTQYYPSDINDLETSFYEMIKCRLITKGVHLTGGKHNEEHDAIITEPPSQIYGGSVFPNKHQTVTELFDTVGELSRFAQHAAKVGANNGKASYEDLEYAVWNIFGFDPKDVVACTKERYYRLKQNNSMQRKLRKQYQRKYWNQTLDRILIKLSVRCPKCKKCFKNIRRGHRSSVELHHLKKRADNDLKAFSNYRKNHNMKTYIKELRKGDADCWCVVCHSDESKAGR